MRKIQPEVTHSALVQLCRQRSRTRCAVGATCTSGDATACRVNVGSTRGIKMSFTSNQIRENGFIHALADDAADEIDAMETRIDQLELCLRECDVALEMLSGLGPVKAIRARIAELVGRAA
jgi:hypothetical protein